MDVGGRTSCRHNECLFRSCTLTSNQIKRVMVPFRRAGHLFDLLYVCCNFFRFSFIVVTKLQSQTLPSVKLYVYIRIPNGFLGQKRSSPLQMHCLLNTYRKKVNRIQWRTLRCWVDNRTFVASRIYPFFFLKAKKSPRLTLTQVIQRQRKTDFSNNRLPVRIRKPF